MASSGLSVFESECSNWSGLADGIDSKRIETDRGMQRVGSSAPHICPVSHTEVPLSVYSGKQRGGYACSKSTSQFCFLSFQRLPAINALGSKIGDESFFSALLPPDKGHSK